MERRQIFSKLYKHLDKPQFTIIVGARQTGKSTLLKQLREQADSDGRITTFLTLEDKNVLADLNESPRNIFAYLKDSEQKQYVFLDEIQYLDDPSNFLKLLYDLYADKLKVTATGSSAFYIDSKFKDSLAGRKHIFTLQTCSFEECLTLSGKSGLLDELKRILSNPSAKSAETDLLRHEFETYMIYGGYPAVVCEENCDEKKDLLRELRDSFLQRDIYESNVKNPDNFYRLFRLLSGQTGNLVNENEISNTLKINAETLRRYLHILQKCFHIALVPPYYSNLRKELTKMKKVYLMDMGMRNCLNNYFPDRPEAGNDGALFENVVFHILAGGYGTDNIFYWRTQDKKEVDFVLPNIDNPFACEVKYNRQAINFRKYEKFTEAYPNIPLRFASLVLFDEEAVRNLLG